MNDPCCYCGLTIGQLDQQGDTVELRLYGPNGAWVCFCCAMATPERERQTELNFEAQLNAAGPIALLDTRDNFGPRPFNKDKAQ